MQNIPFRFIQMPTHPTLDNSPKKLSFVLEILKEVGGIEGWHYTISYCEPADLWGGFPVFLPEFGSGILGSVFGIGPGGAEGDLTAKGCSFFG